MSGGTVIRLSRWYRCGNEACRELHNAGTGGFRARCPKCNAYGMTLVEPGDRGLVIAANPVADDPDPEDVDDELADVTSVAMSWGDINDEEYQRMPTGIAPFDAVLGGGLVPGGMFALGGLPGSGKSSLLMQGLDGTGERVLYATGEQTVGEVKSNGKRIGVEGKRITVVHEPSISGVLAHVRKLKPAILAVDSIQTMIDSTGNGKPGSPTQVTECTRQLMTFAKASGVAVILICHVTNDGSLAGPQTLKHLVDAVFELDPVDDVTRVLRTLTKNRYGNSAIKGRFVMTDHGLEPEDSHDESADDAHALASFAARVTEVACQYIDADMESASQLIDAVRAYQRIYRSLQR